MTILAIICFSIFVYWFRGKKILIYSFVEILIGFSTSLRVFLPDFSYKNLTDISFFQIIAGIYIMVRGFDNLGKALKKTKYNIIWEHYFSVRYK